VGIDDKELIWLENEVKSPPFSAAGRREAGFLLRQLQRGEKLRLPHSRPMPGIGRRCHELRIPDEDRTWRIVHRIDDDAIVVLDVFAKKDRTTPRHIIDTCRKRIKAYDAL
jgi:phage-related protein